MTRLKLLSFWVKHQDQTCCGIGIIPKPLVQTTLGMLNALKEQKQLKENWATDNKEPNYVSITLDLPSATKAFEKIRTILTHVRGSTGVPLVYIIRHQLIPEDEDDNPPFWDEYTTYNSINQEMIARAPILTNYANYTKEYKTLETNRPFAPTFLTDSKKVWAILHACFSTAGAWQYVKKFTTQQNGCQVWCTLHNHFFGGDKINTLYSNILLTLKSLHYSGNHKNFNFDKYYTTDVEQHNCHAFLLEYNVLPLEETAKTHFFEEGITDLSFGSVKSTILVDRLKFHDFDTVMQLYVNFKCSQKS
jgi:hypothetical protein